jgi:Mn-containing catalase
VACRNDENGTLVLELIGGAYGEITVTMQYLFQGLSCRMPGKYKDLIMDVATEEMGHVKMIAAMVARLLEGAPGNHRDHQGRGGGPSGRRGAGRNGPAAGHCGRRRPAAGRRQRLPSNGRYIVASGNLPADFRANAAAETQGRVQAARLYNMTDDPARATC